MPTWVLKVSDAMADTPGTLLTAHTPNLGSGYSEISNGGGDGFKIHSGGTKLAVGAGASGCYALNNTVLGNDQKASMEVDQDTIDATFFFIWVRGSGTNTATFDTYGIFRRHDSDEIALVRYDDGSFSELTSYVADVGVAGEELAVEVVGTAIKGYRDGVEKLSVTDATYASGKVGIGANANDIGVGDNFKAYEQSTANPPVLGFTRRNMGYSYRGRSLRPRARRDRPAELRRAT